MNYSKVEKFIKENAGEKDFTGGIDEEKISKIEQNLQVSLPESYKWFLRKMVQVVLLESKY